MANQAETVSDRIAELRAIARKPPPENDRLEYAFRHSVRPLQTPRPARHAFTLGNGVAFMPLAALDNAWTIHCPNVATKAGPDRSPIPP